MVHVAGRHLESWDNAVLLIAVIIGRRGGDQELAVRAQEEFDLRRQREREARRRLEEAGLKGP